MLKTIVLVQTVEHFCFSGYFDENKVQKKSICFKIETFCNIMNVLTIHLRQIHGKDIHKVPK